MEKKQYKAVIRAQREARRPAKKLIHLLINYRSHNYVRYPKGFTEVMSDIKKGHILFDYDAIWRFYEIEGDRWRQPNFKQRCPKRNYCMEVESTF
jgi:hypothetical protein